MLEIVGVSKRYGSIDALIGVDVRVAPGEIVGLLGPNGAGKTTLLSIAAGLRRPDSGVVRVDGLDPARDHKARQRIGFASQTTGVYPTLSVADNLRLYGRIARLGRDALESRIEEIAAALDLVALLGRRAETLSGGERRRVHVAGAVVTRAPLVILDEATAGVDVDARRVLIDFVRALVDDGTSVLYSTHYLQEVEEPGVRLVILDRGRVIASGDVADLLRRHGRAAVELSFTGPAPTLALPYAVTRREDVLRIATDDPAAALAAALQSLGPDVSRLDAVEILRPSLDSVFAELTGRRFRASTDLGSGDATTSAEANVVPA